MSALTDLTDKGGMRFNSLNEWLTWQEDLHFTSIELGLDRCREVAKVMNLLSPGFTVISIAGTNGKGSSAAMLDLILRNAGYNVGIYTSPHLIRYNERIRIDGVEVSDDLLCQSFSQVDNARGDISLTYFEFGTLAALDIFHRSGIEIAIMEVGLGGRLDAVNILNADVALICSIDLDHENWLGHDRELIGREKAGIFRSNRAAICSDTNPPASIVESAEKVKANLYLSGTDFTYQISKNTWVWKTTSSTFNGLPIPGANGDIQVQNAAGILMVLDVISERFPVDKRDIYTSLLDFSLPGRFQLVPNKIPIVLDVAHNRQSAEVLADSLSKLPRVNETHVVIGMLKDKDHKSVFQALSKITDHWYIVSLDSSRGADSQTLTEVLNRLENVLPVNVFENVEIALQHANNSAQPDDRIIVSGSFLTVGAAIKWLKLDSEIGKF